MENAALSKGQERMEKFIKRRKNLYFSPDAGAVELGEMLQELLGISDEQWGRYAFLREPLAGKTTPQQRVEFVQQAYACGTEYAQKVMKLYSVHSLAQLAQSLKAQVSFPFRPEGGAGAGQVLFARFTHPNKIEVFTDCIQKAEAALQKENVPEALKNTPIADVLLGHELFHMVEEMYADEIYTMTPQIPVKIVGLIPSRAKLICLSEIAAMAFTKELNGLPFTPYLYDVFLVYLYNKQEAYNLFSQVRSL